MTDWNDKIEGCCEVSGARIDTTKVVESGSPAEIAKRFVDGWNEEDAPFHSLMLQELFSVCVAAQAMAEALEHYAQYTSNTYAREVLKQWNGDK